MTPRNFFSALMLSHDALHLETIRKVFDEYGVEIKTVGTVEEADRLITGTRFDLAICDYDVPGAPHLACLNSFTKWRGIAMVVLRDARIPHTHGKRIHFTFPKPVTSDLLARGLRAAYTAMAKQRCATYRHTVALRPMSGTLLHHGSQRPLEQATIVNLSQTGLCLAANGKLPPGGVVSASFPLPESERLVHIIGTVVWSQSDGRSGVRFHHLPEHEQKVLYERLRARLPRDLDYLLGAE